MQALKEKPKTIEEINSQLYLQLQQVVRLFLLVRDEYTIETLSEKNQISFSQRTMNIGQVNPMIAFLSPIQ